MIVIDGTGPGQDAGVVWHPPLPELRPAPEKHDAAVDDPVATWALTLGSDLAGFVAGAVAPVVEVGYYLVKGVACTAAPGLAGCEGPGDDPFTEIFHAVENVQSGVVQFSGREEPWFKQRAVSRIDWLGEVPDARYVTELYLPGTHRSLSRYGGALCECQAWDLEAQLDAGVRALDLRFAHDGQGWAASHGPVWQRDALERVCRVLEAFVQAHPTEVVCVRAEQEGPGPVGAGGLAEALGAVADGLWVRCSAWTTLGDVRGRLVVLETGDHLADWHLGQGTGDHSRQWASVRAHALRPRVPGKLYGTLVGASGRDGLGRKTPAGMAFHVNRELLELAPYVQPGAYFLDFPGTGLLNALIERNGGTRPTWQL